MNSRSQGALIVGIVYGLVVVGVNLVAPSEGAEINAWPQAAGPGGQWIVRNATAPVSWSVAEDRRIRDDCDTGRRYRAKQNLR